MFVLIEHSGTSEHMDIADNIKEFAEDTYGCSCDTVVGGEDAISLYDSSLNKFATLQKSLTPKIYRGIFHYH